MRVATRSAATLVFVVLLAAVAGPARGQEQSQKPSVATSGEAVVYVKPDEVVLSFGVETFDPSLDKSKQQNDAAAATVVRAVKDVGVEDRHLATDQVQVELRYHNGGHPIRGIEGYVCRRSYSVTLKDVKRLDRLIDAVLKNGANRLDGLDFRTTELRKHRDAARKMAARAAKEKADLLAGELGAAVGPPRQIIEGGSFGGYFGGRAWMGNNVGQNAMQVAPAGDGGDTDADAEGTMPLGQIAVRATVSVTFDLR